MDSQENESSDSDLTLISVDEWIKQATDPILRRVEELCALLASRIELKSTGNSEASGSRRDNTSASPSGSQHDMYIAVSYQICLFVIVWNNWKISRSLLIE